MAALFAKVFIPVPVIASHSELSMVDPWPPRFVNGALRANLATASVLHRVMLRRFDVDFETERMITFRHKTSTGFVVPIVPNLRIKSVDKRKSRDCFIGTLF